MSKKKATEHQTAPDTPTAELQTQIHELTRLLQHERADALNLRRRYDEQMASIRESVKLNVIRELLPIIDNFERALKHVPKELSSNEYVRGVSAIVKQFERTLEDMGVHRIETVGKTFDPMVHEAVSMENEEGTHEVVSAEIEAGYQLGNQVIRPARVNVKLQ